MSEGRGKPGASELWTRVAFAILVLTLLLFVYLGLRTGGGGALFAWRYGRDVCFVAALVTLAWGTWWSAVRRPFLRKRRTQAWIVLALVIALTPFQLPYPSSHEGRPSGVPFRLPVEGTWRLLWGGEDKESNRLAGFLAEQRWALALVREEEGVRARAGAGGEHPLAPADFLAFGEPVLAPAPGEVAWTRDGLPDGDLARRAAGVPPLGNLIVLCVAPGQYAFLAHLQEGSLAVGAGERVEAGQLLARAGSSGSSRLVPEPHVLVFLQDSAEEGAGEPIPWFFHGYFADDRYMERSLPRGGVAPEGRLVGERVRHAGSR